MSESVEQADQLLVETVERLFASTCTFEEVEKSEAARWSSTIWDAVAEAGFPWVGVSEEAGGSGGSVYDAAAILRSAGAHSAPIPLAETGLLAGWLLAGAGLSFPAGPMSVVPDPAALQLLHGRLVGSAVVAWASTAERIVAVVHDRRVAVGRPWRVVSLRPEQVSIAVGANMAGEPRDAVEIDVAMEDVESAPAGTDVDRDALLRRGSLSRILLSAGAIEAMAQLAVDYTATRRQFGKPVAAFQAVQQHLVIAAQCSVKASMAADLATRSVARGTNDVDLAAARIIVDAAAVEATRAVHQAHGAMGVTREYPLHHLSRRLWSWRHEYQSGTAWRRQLGEAIHHAGADALFPWISS
jgi:acyl-CoA dehydrogenase